MVIHNGDMKIPFNYEELKVYEYLIFYVGIRNRNGKFSSQCCSECDFLIESSCFSVGVFINLGVSFLILKYKFLSSPPSRQAKYFSLPKLNSLNSQQISSLMYLRFPSFQQKWKGKNQCSPFERLLPWKFHRNRSRTMSYFVHGWRMYKVTHLKQNTFKQILIINFYFTELLVKYTAPDDEETQNKVLGMVSNYCGSPVTNYTLDQYPADYIWTFYHSFWFAFTTCSTVGKFWFYGPKHFIALFFSITRLRKHLATWFTRAIIFNILCSYWIASQWFPVSIFGRIFWQNRKSQIIFGFNDFMRKFTQYIGIYTRYKDYKYATTKDYAPQKFGMIAKIMLYLVPGIVFFIFLPACLFTYFEDWTYVTSVYYAFVSLTTIGFGDYVPTYQNGQVRNSTRYEYIYTVLIRKKIAFTRIMHIAYTYTRL